MNIGIVGYGVVGKAIAQFHADWGDCVFTYDIKDRNADERLKALNEKCEIVFVCVPTPATPQGPLDCAAVYDAVSKLEGSKTVIIKSSVMPGTTDMLQATYPEHQFFFVPEFLSEDTAAEDYANPRRTQIVGIPGLEPDAETYKLQRKCINILPSQDLFLTDAVQAELLKLATNAFYATKVALFNTFYDAGMTQPTLYALADDPWIGKSHCEIEHKGYRGYGGKCLPKDIGAMRTVADSDVLVAVEDYNAKLVGNDG